MAEPHTAAEEALKKVAARLECAICLDQYKDPKLLSCFHVFCKQCLEYLVRQEEGQWILQCPNCRRTTTLPSQGVSGLQSDFHAHHLFEIQDTLAKAKGPQKTQCEKCKKSTATSFCQDCSKFICDKCTEMHQMWEDLATHQIVTMQDAQAGATNLVPPKKKEKGLSYCLKHEESVLKIYCETCNELICSDCTIRLHQGHTYDLVSDTFPKHKQDIVNQLDPVKRHLATVNQALQSFDARSKAIQDQRVAIQVDVHKQIDQLHQSLEQRRSELIGQLDQLTQHKLKSLAAQRDNVELLHAQLTSCLEYVEGSLETGTQEEILKMKGPLLDQVSLITADFNPNILAPEEEADILLVADVDACEKFAEVYVVAQSPCPEKCYSTGDGLKSRTVGEPATITVHAITQGGKEYRQPVEGLTAELVYCRDKATVECQVRRVGDSNYEIQYQPVTRGQHQLHVRINGKSIKGSPYTVVARPSLQSLGKPVRTITNVKQPWGVATNSKGQIVVAESGGHCVSVFTPEGQKIRSFGSCGSAQGQFIGPRGVAVARDDIIIVTDYSNHRVQKFTSEGNFLMTVGATGSSPLQFSCPAGVCINKTNDKLYIAEQNNHRIQILNMDFTYSGSIGGSGSGDKHLSNPCDVAFDSSNNLYIADTGNRCIKVFSPEGEFLRKFRSSDRQAIPYSITIDSNDSVYVADSQQRVSVLTAQGQFLGSFGNRGAADGKLRNPAGVTVDQDGSILVADLSHNRIQVF